MADRSSERQRDHYNAILDEYDQHYFDAESLQYRDRFFYDPMLEGIHLNGMRVIDLACGSGMNSRALLKRFPNMDIVGLDISSEACARYRANVGRPALESDLTSPVADLPDAADAVFVIGGLHHCVSDLSTALLNVARMVKPGGMVMMAEPSASFFLNGVRRLWYRHDRYFDAPTEAPLEESVLSRMAFPYFEPDFVRYMGGVGYVLVFNSLVVRMPRKIKRFIARPLMLLDGCYNLLPGHWPFAYFVARWRRTSTPAG